MQVWTRGKHQNTVLQLTYVLASLLCFITYVHSFMQVPYAYVVF